MWLLNHANKEGSSLTVDQAHIVSSSGVVLLVASCEAALEDILRFAMDRLLDLAQEPSSLPGNLSKSVQTQISKPNNIQKMWALAGDGWKGVCQEQIEFNISKVHSAKPDTIDKLYENTLGLKGLSDCWAWEGATADQNKSALIELIDVRSEIAHTGKTNNPLDQKYLLGSLDLVSKIVLSTINKTHELMHKKYGIPINSKYDIDSIGKRL